MAAGKYIQETGGELVNDKQQFKQPVDFVKALLDMRDKYDRIVIHAFDCFSYFHCWKRQVIWFHFSTKAPSSSDSSFSSSSSSQSLSSSSASFSSASAIASMSSRSNRQSRK